MENNVLPESDLLNENQRAKIEVRSSPIIKSIAVYDSVLFFFFKKKMFSCAIFLILKQILIILSERTPIKRRWSKWNDLKTGSITRN